jgi:TP901 family phage tail tape measure protein
MKGLAAHTTSQIQASKMSGEVYESLAKKLKGASGETIQYKTALSQAAVEAGTSTIRFNQLSSALLSNEKNIFQTGAALKKLGGEFGTDQSIKTWAAGVDRLQYAHATLNGEMIKSGGIVLDAKTKYMDFQRGVTSLKDQFGTAAWSALEMDTRLGSQVKTMGQAKAELTNYMKTMEPFNVHMGRAVDSVGKASAAMSLMGQNGEKWAAGVDKGAVATAFMNNQLINANGTLLQTGKTIAQTDQEVAKIEKSFKKLGPETFGEIRSQLGTTITSLTDYKNALQVASDKGVAARTSIETLNKAHAELSKVTGLSATAQNALAESVAKGGISIDNAVNAGKKLVDSHTRAEAASKTLSSQIVKLNADFGGDRGLANSTGVFREKFDSLVKSLDGSKDKFTTVSADVQRLNTEFTKNQKGMDSFHSAIKNIGDQSPKTAAYISQLTSQIEKGTLTHADAAKKIDAHGAELRKLGIQANSTSGFWANLTGKLVGGGAAANAATDYFSRLGQAVGSLAAWIPAALIIGTLTEVISGSVSAVKEYDQALKSLQAISGGTEAEISLLGKEMLHISDVTKYSAAEIAKGAIYIAQAGFTAGESLQVISSAARGAQGTLEPLTTAADLLTTVLRAFHINASESAHVMDMLAMAANKSKTDLEGMKVVFNYLGPAAYSAGLGLNETLGTLMALSNVGMRMSTVGTSLRQVFIGLENPSSKLKKALAEMGMTVDDLSVKKMGGLLPVLQNLNKVIGGSLTNAVQFFNVRAGNAALVISEMNAHVGMMIEFTKQYGASAAMAGKQSEGMAVQLATLSNQFQNFIIRMAEGGLTDTFKLVIYGVKNLITAVEYLVNNSFTNFLITTGLMYVAMTTMYSMVLKLAAAFTTWAISGVLPVVTEFMKVHGIISTMQTAFKGLGTHIIATTTSIVQATIGFISFASRIEAGTGLVAVFTVAWQSLNRAFVGSPIGIVILGLSLLAAALYTLATSSEKHSKALQENTITYANNAQKAEGLAAKLRELAAESGDAAKGSDSHVAVLKQIRDTFPEVTAEIVKNKDSLEGQAVALDKVAEGFRKQNEIVARAALEDITRQYKEAGVEAIAFSEAVAAQRNQLVQLIMGLGGAVNWLINIIPALRGSKSAANEVTYAWAQMQLAWNTTSAQAVVEAASKSEAALNKQRSLYPQVASIIINSNASVRQSVIDSYPESEMKKMALGVVAVFDRMAQSLEGNFTEVEKKQMLSISVIGGEWENYYMRQDALGKADVASYAAKANKKIEEEMKAFQKGVTNDELIKTKRAQLEKDAWDDMLNKRGKNIEDILKLEDKLYEEQHKRRKQALEVTLGQMDLEQKAEIMNLSNQNLKEADFLIQKEAIEAKYFERNKAAIAANTEAELAALNNVYQAKLKSLEIDTTLTEEARKSKLVTIEAENSIKIVAIYREQMAAYKTHISEKLTEFNKYKTEYDKTLKEIEKAEEAHLKVIAEANEKHRKGVLAAEKQYRKDIADGVVDASKKTEDLEKMKRDALQLTMDFRQKAADKQLEVDETISKGYQTLREIDLKGETETIAAKIKIAKDYFNEAGGMISGLVIQNQKSDGQLVQDDKATQELRIGFINKLLEANRVAAIEVEKAAIAKREKVKADLDFEKNETIRVDGEKRDAIITNLNLIAEASKKNMESVSKSINDMMTAYNDLVEAVNEQIIIKADTTQTYEELKKLTEHIKTRSGAGDYNVVLQFMGKASPEGPIAETIKTVKDYFIVLMADLEKMIGKFVVQFLGDATGEGTSTLSSTINWVDDRMTKLYNSINGMKAVFTVVTRYVTEGDSGGSSSSEGGPGSFDSSSDTSGIDANYGSHAEGGVVPGEGDSDSYHAMLTPGEGIINKPAMKTLGTGFLNFVNSLKSFNVPKFNMGGVVPALASRTRSEEVFTLNLQAGSAKLPLQVLGNSNSMRNNIRQFEKELSRMRLSHG